MHKDALVKDKWPDEIFDLKMRLRVLRPDQKKQTQGLLCLRKEWLIEEMDMLVSVEHKSFIAKWILCALSQFVLVGLYRNSSNISQAFLKHKVHALESVHVEEVRSIFSKNCALRSFWRQQNVLTNWLNIE